MYLVDMDGNVVHTWKHTDPPGLHAVLLPDGSLLRPMRLGSKAKARVGGPSGGFQIIDWNGKVLREFILNEPDRITPPSSPTATFRCTIMAGCAPQATIPALWKSTC